MVTDRIPAEMWHPGEFVWEEIEARRWPLQAWLPVQDVVAGRRDVDQGTAEALAQAFGCSSYFFLALQQAYDSWVSNINVLRPRFGETDRPTAEKG